MDQPIKLGIGVALFIVALAPSVWIYELRRLRRIEVIAIATAVEQHDVPKVRRLLLQGVDPNAKFCVDNTSEVSPYTPWRYAFTRGTSSKENKQIVLLMLRHGADPNARDDDGRTCNIHLQHDPEVRKALKLAGAR